MEKKTVIMKEKMELSKVVACLEDILAGLKEGTLCIQHGEDLVTLKPGAFVELEIEAAVKKGKEKFTLELNWHNEKEKGLEEKEFRIMTSEPVEETVAAE